MPITFKAGDVVYLPSTDCPVCKTPYGDKKMTVEGHEGGMLRCVWFEGAELRRMFVAPGQVELMREQ
jgi:uncharacterized protein YodC (DUF2158 family)